ncbi:hypothetical protein ACJMK2_013644 [Sinanodonta woodiana]|uniref:C2H2-type domain-containing protein n=1 Tax=Sinanodonta woodiana TaxID=1069815 RepID=A0ABD3UY54_SINWO
MLTTQIPHEEKVNFPSRPKRTRFDGPRHYDVTGEGGKTLELRDVIEVLKAYNDYDGGINCSLCGKLYKSRVCFTKHIWEHSVYWDLFEGAKNHDRVLSIQAALILYSGYQGCISVDEDPLKNLLVTFPNVPGERKDCPGSPDYKIRSTKTTPKKRTSPLKRKKSFED